MTKPLYEKFVEWVIERYAFEPDCPCGGRVITEHDLRKAAQEWIRRSRNGHRPKLAAERRPTGRQRIIPEGTKCQNPFICGNKAEVFGPDGLMVCGGCRRRWKRTGSLEPGKLGRPQVNMEPCACGKPATKKGKCDSCYSKERYANNRTGA